MSASRTVPAAVAITLAASLSSVSLSGQSVTRRDVAATVVSTDAAQSTNAPSVSSVTRKATLSTLARVKAEPMTSKELNTVKGTHVHFVVPSSQNDQYGLTGLHLAGNPFEHNWSNLGGSDPAPVAPSYHGLCKAAAGPGPLFIPYPPNFTQCP